MSAALMVVSAVVTLLAASYYLDPNRTLRYLENRLANGNRMTLIDKQGEPLWSEWWLNGGGACSLNSEGIFTVHCDNLCLLALVTDPKTSSFRFFADVRHERSDPLGGDVGLFFLAAKSETPKGSVHSFFELSFNDIIDSTQNLQFLPVKPTPMPTGNPVYFRPRFDGSLKAKPGGFSPRLFQPAGLKGGDWHTLRIEVDPSGIRGFWDGKPVGSASWETITNDVAKNLARTQTHAFFSAVPRSPLGIFVERGTASFKNVVLEPGPN
jgi:hypothetical protein